MSKQDSLSLHGKKLRETEEETVPWRGRNRDPEERGRRRGRQWEMEAFDHHDLLSPRTLHGCWGMGCFFFVFSRFPFQLRWFWQAVAWVRHTRSAGQHPGRRPQAHGIVWYQSNARPRQLTEKSIPLCTLRLVFFLLDSILSLFVVCLSFVLFCFPCLLVFFFPFSLWFCYLFFFFCSLLFYYWKHTHPIITATALMDFSAAISLIQFFLCVHSVFCSQWSFSRKQIAKPPQSNKKFLFLHSCCVVVLCCFYF